MPVSVLKKPLTAEVVGDYQVVCLIGTDHETRLKVNAWTREKNTKFIACQTVGLFGFAFNDFGTGFHVSDATGENPVVGMISGISKVTILI